MKSVTVKLTQQEQRRISMEYKRNPQKILCPGPIEGLHESTEHLDIFLFPPTTQWCSISNVLLTGGRGVSDFISLLKYY